MQQEYMRLDNMYRLTLLGGEARAFLLEIDSNGRAGQTNTLPVKDCNRGPWQDACRHFHHGRYAERGK